MNQILENIAYDWISSYLREQKIGGYDDIDILRKSFRFLDCMAESWLPDELKIIKKDHVLSDPYNSLHFSMKDIELYQKYIRNKIDLNGKLIIWKIMEAVQKLQSEDIPIDYILLRTDLYENLCLHFNDLHDTNSMLLNGITVVKSQMEQLGIVLSTSEYGRFEYVKPASYIEEICFIEDEKAFNALDKDK